MWPIVVVDTNVFVSACLGSGPVNLVIEACLLKKCRPLMGAALFAEYEEVLSRDALWQTSALTSTERHDLLDIFLSLCEWTCVYFAWRPNLPGEGDNHLIELAVAGSANAIITRNLRDLVRSELLFPGLRMLDPRTFMKELMTWQP